MNAASPGDTVLLSDGNTARSASASPSDPPEAGHKPVLVLRVRPEPQRDRRWLWYRRQGGVGAAGAMVDGLYLRWHGTGIDVDARVR